MTDFSDKQYKKVMAACKERDQFPTQAWIPDEKEEKLTNEIEEDKINPSHYTQGKIEVIDFILDQKKDYLTATIIKYMSRWRFKDGTCDLKKAKWFLDKLIEQEEK